MVFVPSRGFLFFYWNEAIWNLWKLFSSPHGDFSFSILKEALKNKEYDSFRPLTGISLFLSLPTECWSSPVRFSSPHGDFSFSMKKHFLKKYYSFVFVPSRGFLFFYDVWKEQKKTRESSVFVPSRGFLFFYFAPVFDTYKKYVGFRPLTGISLFLYRISFL